VVTRLPLVGHNAGMNTIYDARPESLAAPVPIGAVLRWVCGAYYLAWMGGLFWATLSDGRHAAIRLAGDSDTGLFSGCSKN